MRTIAAPLISSRPMRALWRRLIQLGAAPDEAPEVRLRRQLQVAMALASLPAVGLWGAIFFLMHRPDAGWLPLSYCAGTVGLLALLGATRRWSWFRGPHLSL